MFESFESFEDFEGSECFESFESNLHTNLEAVSPTQRPKPRRLIGARDRILPLFFSSRGEALAHEKKAHSQRASPPLLQCEGGGFDLREGAFSACMWAPRNNNQNGETTIKMDFLGAAIFGAGCQEIRAPSQRTRDH